MDPSEFREKRGGCGSYGLKLAGLHTRVRPGGGMGAEGVLMEGGRGGVSQTGLGLRRPGVRFLGGLGRQPSGCRRHLVRIARRGGVP